MPDLGQVRTACYRVMRQEGLAGVTIGKVAAMMRKNGVAAGSRRDLTVMVRAYRDEQKTLRELPPGVLELAQKLAQAVWEIALETASQLETQRGGEEQPTPRTRSPKRRTQALARLDLLQTAVEALLRKDAKDSFSEPPTAVDILRKLPPEVADLTDEKHIPRDLLKIEERSNTLFRLGNKRWWRRDRALPPEQGARSRGYERTGTELSLRRTENKDPMNAVVAVLIKARRGMARREIAAALDVEPANRERFYQMIRNHPRAKTENARFYYEDGKYFAVRRVGKSMR